MTCGIRTSEFYVTIFGVSCGLLAGLLGLDAGVIGAMLSPALAYIGGRSYIKKGKGDAESVSD